jgi:hypothetical protein
LVISAALITAAQIFAGADDAQGDLAAVGDQNFFKHAGAA